MRKRSSFFIREKSQVQCIRVVFPFCSSCRPHCLPIPSVPQLDLSSLSLSSLGTSTIVKHDESCKINSVRLNIYKRSFFTHIANGMSFKSLVTKWGAWASKNPKILPVTYIEKYMDSFFFSTVQFLVDIHQRKNFLQTIYLTTLLKMIFYSNEAWIALHVGMVHFV